MTTASDIESPSDNIVTLPEELLGEEPEALKQALLAVLVRGQPAILDGARVHRVGTAALQVLLAFLRDCSNKSLAVQLRAPSRALLDAFECTGLATDALLEKASS